MNTKYITNYFSNLDVFTEKDKEQIRTFCRIKIKNKKIVLSNNFVKNVNYQKNVSVIEKSQEYIELSTLSLGQVNWFNNLTKKTKKFLHDKCYVKTMQDKNVYSISDYTYNNIIDKCHYKVEKKFDDSLLDSTGDVDIEVFRYFYQHNKLPETEKDKYMKILKYVVDEEIESEEWIDMNGDIKSDKVAEYINKSLPSTTKEKMRISLNRTKEKFDNLAKTNADKFNYFLTLTFAHIKNKEKHLALNANKTNDDHSLEFSYLDDTKNFDDTNKALNRFLDFMKKRFKKVNKEFYYLGVPEFQSNGSIHYHFLINDILDGDVVNVPSWLDYDFNKNERSYGLMTKYWYYGKSDIQEINDKKRVTSYIAKYLMKNLEEMDKKGFYEKLNKRRYYYSRNLTKPTIEYDYENKYLEESDYTDLFVSYKTNGFNNSKIETTIYTLSSDDEKKIYNENINNDLNEF